ncbi:MAG: hypothetical protein WD638_12055 [Nitriliruptoraceae bacterium]
MIHLTSWRAVTAAATAAALAAGAFGIGAAVSNPPAAPTPIELASEGTALSDPIDDEALVPSIEADAATGEATPTPASDDSVAVDGASEEVVTPDAAPTEAPAPQAAPVDPDSPEESVNSVDSDDSPDSAS